MKYVLLSAILLAGLGLAGCSKDSNEGVENLPPAKLKPDASRAPANDNPGGAAPSSAL